MTRAARADTKFVVVLADGMADFPLDGLGGRTPLEAAHTPNMDAIAARGVVGLLNPIPPSQKPGSDAGNLSVLGYDPDRYLTGRAPLEAAAMGVALQPSDVAFRCNLVTLDGDRMADYSAGHISSHEAAELIAAVHRRLSNSRTSFHAGVQYRHLLVTKDDVADAVCTPPHDIVGEPFEPHLPRGPGGGQLREWIAASWSLLREHPVNEQRRREGKAPANSIWLWGQGHAPSMPTYAEKYGLHGSAVSAVDLVRGIATYAGLRVLEVPGITGYLDTDYTAKALYGLKSLDEGKFVYIHVEAPDEAAHLGSPEEKIAAIEAIDREIVGRVLHYMRAHPATRAAVLPDHVTAIATRTHAHGVVPFAACGTGIAPGDIARYSEASASASALRFPRGHEWMDWFLMA
jgi:2,3-bisphosphoglycerate-independent phosphoglycerate mutase